MDINLMLYDKSENAADSKDAQTFNFFTFMLYPNATIVFVPHREAKRGIGNTVRPSVLRAGLLEK